jgi:hypothetical protein
VTYLPWGVDAALFCPWPRPPARAIDICGIGGISQKTHEALVDHADRTGMFYLYNTIVGRHGMVSHAAHRHNYAGTLKRSKYFLTYLAKYTRAEERGRQEEFGLRYIEGVSAGAVLLGNRVCNPAFEEYLGWTDSVIDIPFRCETPGAIVTALEADPGRVAAIRRRNVVNALQRHDHLHRWRAVLDIAGLPECPALVEREARLERLAEAATQAPDEQVLGLASHRDPIRTDP